MKNADLPAIPGEYDHNKDCEGMDVEQYLGLTKREIFAMHAMQGIQSCAGQDMSCDWAAAQAVKCADALLKELGR